MLAETGSHFETSSIYLGEYKLAMGMQPHLYQNIFGHIQGCNSPPLSGSNGRKNQSWRAATLSAFPDTSRFAHVSISLKICVVFL